MDRNQGERLPQFIVIGPPRTATTWLDKVFRGQIALPEKIKETHYFSRNYELGPEWYASHFENAGRYKIVGEICASYFENPLSLERIHKDIPNCKIVCTLRDPVDRLYSYYKLMRYNGKSSLTFEETLENHPKMLRFSRYATLLKNWVDKFGADNVLVVLNDDLAADPAGYVEQITTFLGIDPVKIPDSATSRNRENRIETTPRSAALARAARSLRSWLQVMRLYPIRAGLKALGVWRFCCEGGAPYPSLAPATRSRLQAILAPEIEALETMIGRDLSAWKNSSP